MDNNIKEIYLKLKNKFSQDGSKIVAEIVKNSNKIEEYINTKIDNKLVARICQNCLNILKYADQQEKTYIAEGFGSFLKKKFIKIFICVLLLVLFLPGTIMGGYLGTTFGANTPKASKKAQSSLIFGIMGAGIGTIKSPQFVLSTVKSLFNTDDSASAIEKIKTKSIEYHPFNDFKVNNQ